VQLHAIVNLMDVFLVPIGASRYALYCEPSADPDVTADPVAQHSLIEKVRHKFSVLLRAAEERQHAHVDPMAAPKTWGGRIQDRILRWVAERIAEQRLLWHLRRQHTAVAVHPQDLTFEQGMSLVRRILQHDYDRHRRWLVLDTIGIILSAPFMVVPGPNILAYYFAFRIWGHWLSMRGASEGLHRVTWSGRPCPPLSELREVATLEPGDRDARVHDIAARLRLQHFSTFFERVSLRHA
jgi:hypothetical protein